MQKYPFLRFATTVLRVVGWIVLIGGVIVSIYFGATTGGVMGAFTAVALIIGSFLAWLFLLVNRELVYLFIHVKENTRNTAESITENSN